MGPTPFVGGGGGNGRVGLCGDGRRCWPFGMLFPRRKTTRHVSVTNECGRGGSGKSSWLLEGASADASAGGGTARRNRHPSPVRLAKWGEAILHPSRKGGRVMRVRVSRMTAASRCADGGVPAHQGARARCKGRPRMTGAARKRSGYSQVPSELVPHSSMRRHGAFLLAACSGSASPLYAPVTRRHIRSSLPSLHTLWLVWVPLCDKTGEVCRTYPVEMAMLLQVDPDYHCAHGLE
ncbi:hypothetical protein BDY17DRAFT_53515 [Neohortaea acidophila]|uniref:Uncharacterized protein n=1 Tax=Neohortaea acidophila TaxID=245834 RepID=A0A6A6PHT5_9PEZI|nr:uncharacterized protein BDY17DRAFT_53515 [Neohortaea acidophila]KAF2479274.1 hypothetical protein BDY17DRAFT_53515 [Neohortaea acidophila]